jgi:AcrR family transcriptional regulator
MKANSDAATGRDGTIGQERAGAAARRRILAAAEKLFGERGYDGASVRQIALAADVPLALVNYHFGSKEGLYRAIFELRSPTIVDQRVAGLQVAESELDPDKRLELVVKALIVPMIHLRNTEKNASFARILAREVSDPSSRNRSIIADFFDPVARLMIKAIAEALPDRTLEEVHWGYHIMLGAMVFTMADVGRIARLSDGRCDPDDETSTAAHLVALLHAALKHGKLGRPGDRRGRAGGRSASTALNHKGGGK